MVGNRRRFGSVACVALGVLGFGSVLLGVVSSPAVAATGTWSTPANLSAAGGDASDPQISVNAAGTAVAIWYRHNGSNNIVQSASSTDGGVTWSPTVNNLSAAGGDAYGPQISVNAAGTAIAVWYRDNGSNYIVQTSPLTLPSLADTGTTSGTAITGLGVGAGLLAAGAVALVVVRRRLAHK